MLLSYPMFSWPSDRLPANLLDAIRKRLIATAVITCCTWVLATPLWKDRWCASDRVAVKDEGLRLAGHPAAVYGEDGAGDVVAGGGTEEEGGAG